jgi:hypothetical protein
LGVWVYQGETANVSVSTSISALIDREREKRLRERRSGRLSPAGRASGERRFSQLLAILRGSGLSAVNRKAEKVRSEIIWLPEWNSNA